MRAVLGFVSAIGLFLASASPLRADDFSFSGYADARLVLPAGEVSWLKGGLGKLRFGGPSESATGRFVEAVGQVDWQPLPDWSAVVLARVEPNQRTGIDALEAYVRYSPEPFGDWTASLKAGAFFPPISLENDDLGWTSPYTLTPSAIDSWVGDELRTIGVEANVGRNTPIGTFTALGALFCCNDPAGILIALRGWSLDDRPTALFEEPHEPNISLGLLGRDFPDRIPLFREFDNRAGWYAGATWEIPGIGFAQILRYDNQASPTAHDTDYFAWNTQFWSAGLSTRFMDTALLFQGLRGATQSDPWPGVSWNTDFWSAYALASYDVDNWRFSGRAELFETTDANTPSWQAFTEHGHALTAAASWFPKDWLRVTAEFIRLNAMRPERVQAGLSEAEIDNQFQLGLRASL